jgi:hypothetical protein
MKPVVLETPGDKQFLSRAATVQTTLPDLAMMWRGTNYGLHKSNCKLKP